MSTDDLWRLSATAAVAALRSGDLRSADLVEAAIRRIEAVDDRINALPIRCFERALEQAKVLDNGGSVRTGLAGLPIAVKDYNDVGGVRTTYGSPLYAGHCCGGRLCAPRLYARALGTPREPGASRERTESAHRKQTTRHTTA